MATTNKMSSGDESDTNDVVLQRETQFVPRSDDDEVLWEVQEILAERGRKYRVRWAGVDPMTGKPWPPSWVAKHDCTDKLVAEWIVKKKRIAAGKGKRGGRKVATSRASSSSKRTRSAVSTKRTRPSLSEATSSRVDSVERQPAPSIKKSMSTTTAKRKRQVSGVETPARATTSGAGTVQEDPDEFPRPQKKQKMVLEALLAPLISSDDDDDATAFILAEKSPVKVAPIPLKKSNGSLAEGSGEEGSSLLKNKNKSKSLRRQNSGSKNSVVVGADEEETRSPHPKMTSVTVLKRKTRVVTVLSEDEESRSFTSKKKPTSRRTSPVQNGDVRNDEVEPVVSSIKIGPPRGVKQREKSRMSGTLNKHGPSRVEPRANNSADERVETSSTGATLSIQQDIIDKPVPPQQIPIPVVPLNMRSHSPNLSPGARARLELFDRMMVEASLPAPALPAAGLFEPVLDDASFDHNDGHDIFNGLDFDIPLPLSPLPSTSRPKAPNPSTFNGLVIPETESSGYSQSLPAPPKPPPQLPSPRDKSPREVIDLPMITVITSSATSPSPSKDLLPPPQKSPSPAKPPSKQRVLKPVTQISSNTFRSTINAHVQAATVETPEAPLSSIESFESPKRVDKGKQRAIEDDHLESSLSEREGEGERWEGITESKPTDSELKRSAKELWQQTLQRRRAEHQKKKSVKQLKELDEIVSETTGSPLKRSSLPLANEGDNALSLQWEDVDINGGNSTTLDTLGQGDVRPLTEEEQARLRVALRQEEEESTQEAMGMVDIPPPPVPEPKVVDNADVQMPPPKASKNSESNGRTEADSCEQPPSDLQLVSVIVQPSQEQRHEDTDVEPLVLSLDQRTSSPARPIPEDMADEPERRLVEVLSLLHSKSEEIERLGRELLEQRRDMEGLTTELAEVRQSAVPTGPVLAAWEAERAQWSQERSKWESDRTIWETQRKEWDDERTSLSARVSELSDASARAEELGTKLSAVEAERATWASERDGMLDKMTQHSEEMEALNPSRREFEQERVRWESEKASWAEERAKWETERVALMEKQETLSSTVDELTARVESVTTAKASAEKDSEFFREQYAQASGFVGSIREENAELEKRVQIAEGQAQEGVAAIKAMFEGRVKALQADVDRWKGLTELLQEKDRRTNDELRLRAAQVPELLELCSRFQTENKSLDADVRKRDRAQQRHAIRRHKLYHEIYVLKKEKVSLRIKLSRLVNMTGSNSTQETIHSASAPPALRHPTSMDSNSNERAGMGLLPDPTSQSSESCDTSDEADWFPCLWRPQWRDQCQHVFDTKEDLERHLQAHFRDLTMTQ